MGVAVVDIAPGERAVGIYMDDDSKVEIEALEPVPLGHKIALVSVDPNAAVLEYGIQIGNAPAGFAAGSHVHTHNLKSARW